MVQILEPGTNFGSQLGQSLGQGISRGADFAIQMQMQKKQQREKQKMVESLLGQKSPEMKPEDKKKQFLEMLPEIENKIGRELTSSDLDQLWQQPEVWQQLTGQSQQSQQREDPFSKAKAAAVMGEHDLSRVFSDEAKSQEKKEAASESKRQFGHTKSEKYAEKLASDATQGEEMKYGIKLIKDAMKSGKSGPSSRNLAQKYLEHAKSPLADLFATPESGKFNVGMKTLAGGFKQIMGAKPTEREFFWYENILPSLLKNVETNEAIVDYFENVSDFSLKAQEAADQIIAENQGYRPIDLDVQVRDKMRPVFNDLINQGMGLLSEVDQGKGKGKSEKKQSKQQVFTELPDPGSFKNKTMRDPDTGKRYKSDGNQWLEV